MPTGGISSKNTKDWIRRRSCLSGNGRWISQHGDSKKRQFDQIKMNVIRFLSTIH